MNKNKQIIKELKNWVSKYYTKNVPQSISNYPDASETEIDTISSTQAHLAYEVGQILGMNLQEPTLDYGDEVDEEKGIYNVMDIAIFLIKYHNADGGRIDNFRLQLLLYLLHVSFENYDKGQLFKDDFELKSFGPIIPEVYMRFRGYGACPIFDIGLNFEDEIDIWTGKWICHVVDNLSRYTWKELEALAKSTYELGGNIFADSLEDTAELNELRECLNGHDKE